MTELIRTWMGEDLIGKTIINDRGDYVEITPIEYWEGRYYCDVFKYDEEADDMVLVGRQMCYTWREFIGLYARA